jgi:HSP20 family protein
MAGIDRIRQSESHPMHLAGPSLGSHFDKLADHVWEMMKELEKSNLFHLSSSPEWCPRLNLYETPAAFLVCVELAGVQRQKIDLHAENGSLFVRGVRERPVLPENPDEVSVHLMEIDSGRFQRKVSIPSDVDVEAIRASYRHGYLWIVLPRRHG